VAIHNIANISRQTRPSDRHLARKHKDSRIAGPMAGWILTDGLFFFVLIAVPPRRREGASRNLVVQREPTREETRPWRGQLRPRPARAAVKAGRRRQTRGRIAIRAGGRRSPHRWEAGGLAILGRSCRLGLCAVHAGRAAKIMLQVLQLLRFASLLLLHSLHLSFEEMFPLPQSFIFNPLLLQLSNQVGQQAQSVRTDIATNSAGAGSNEARRVQERFQSVRRRKDARHTS
jgi:hypothetical protein